MTSFYASGNGYMNLISKYKGSAWSSSLFPFKMTFLTQCIIQLLLFKEELNVLLITTELYENL